MMKADMYKTQLLPMQQVSQMYIVDPLRARYCDQSGTTALAALTLTLTPPLVLRLLFNNNPSNPHQTLPSTKMPPVMDPVHVAIRAPIDTLPSSHLLRIPGGKRPYVTNPREDD